MISGNEILAKALARQEVEVFFFIMGGPMIDAENACLAEGMRGLDVRHEQAAAMMAHAYSRLRRRPGVCMAASGPGTTNLVTGIANAYVDCAPVVALGGSSPLGLAGQGAFQELDQVSLMRPITKWSFRVTDTRRIPEAVDTAFQRALTGQPGPVYVDLPGDVLYRQVDEQDVRWEHSTPAPATQRTPGDPKLVEQALELIARAQRPVLVTGSGALWSGAAEQVEAFVERSGIPFYTTPQGRGVVPEDHPLCFLPARSTAFREADLVLVFGTRLNYVIEYARPPRFSEGARLIQVDIEPAEIGRSRAVDVGIVGDVGAVLGQMLEADGRLDPTRYREWTRHLEAISAVKRAEQEEAMSVDQRPMHPLRLCKEVRDFLPRDAILVVDGQEILNYGRQSIPTFVPGHRLNSGPFGTMGVGLPYGLGAKVACPDKTVLVLHGDGSFGLNAMEVDTAVRHNLPVVTVISNNGGWTGTDRFKAGRELGFSRYDLMAAAFGCHAEFVEEPEGVHPALERAFASGKPSVVNVITDPKARARTGRYAVYST